MKLCQKLCLVTMLVSMSRTSLSRMSNVVWLLECFYHPDQKEEVFMNELRACLSKELSFKQITQAMMTPPLVIDTFYEKSSYAEWNIALTSVFLGLVLVGVLVELYKHVKIKKKKASE